MYIVGRIGKEFFGEVEIWVGEVPNVTAVNAGKVNRKGCRRNLGKPKGDVAAGSLHWRF